MHPDYVHTPKQRETIRTYRRRLDAAIAAAPYNVARLNQLRSKLKNYARREVGHMAFSMFWGDHKAAYDCELGNAERIMERRAAA